MCDCTNGCKACSSAICLPRGPQGPGLKTVYYNVTRVLGSANSPAIIPTNATFTVPVSTGNAKYEVVYYLHATLAASQEVQISAWHTPISTGVPVEIDANAKRHVSSDSGNAGTILQPITFFVSDFTMGDDDIFHIEAFCATPAVISNGVIKLSQVIA